MPIRFVHFTNAEIYHVLNRGTEQRPIFSDKRDYTRFINLLTYYQYERSLKYSNSTKNEATLPVWKGKGTKLAEVICFCLMPNHFHLMVKQLEVGGISKFLRVIQNSYAKYFNIKYKRIGSLFQGRFQAVHVTTDEQFMHVSRYIHLNPVVAEMVDNPKDFEWSSYKTYINNENTELINKEALLTFFRSSTQYEKFVLNHLGYAKMLNKIKHLVLDN